MTIANTAPTDKEQKVKRDIFFGGYFFGIQFALTFFRGANETKWKFDVQPYGKDRKRISLVIDFWRFELCLDAEHYYDRAEYKRWRKDHK